MESNLYPWGGEFTVGDAKSSVAIVLLNIEYSPSNKVAIYGPLKTENIGVEKIVANVISNPYIRYIIVCGEEIRGHKSGNSLIALNKNGIDKQNRIINAPGAIPYIENLDKKAIDRFQSQIEIVDLIGKTEKKEIDTIINKYLKKSTSSFGDPYIAIKITTKKEKIEDKRALHSKIIVDYMGKIIRRKK